MAEVAPSNGRSTTRDEVGMPAAAAPRYLTEGADAMSSSSPAIRFGFLLPVWTTRQDQERDVRQRANRQSREGREVKEKLRYDGMDATIRWLMSRDRNRLSGLWDKNTSAARQAWKSIAVINQEHARCVRGLVDRQAAMAQSGALAVHGVATAPFTTGLGNEHPLENGFAFLSPYGMPYLPGSGVKGVVRKAAQELASGEWGDGGGWSNEKRWSIDAGGQRPPVPLSMIDALFGREPPSGDRDHIRGALAFWDAIPQIAGSTLTVEIMTPHHSHYYQQKEDAGAGSTTPHDSGQPNPIPFLTVPPGSQFAFHVTCDQPHLKRLAPQLLEDERWKTLLKIAFRHAFEWLGFGAKTAVGYGAMEPDRRVEEATREQAEREAKRQARQEEERLRREAEQAASARLQEEQARFDALPEGRKRIIELQRTLDAVSGGTHIGESSRNEAKAKANRLIQTDVWSDTKERQDAAELLESVYEVIGWHDPGRNRKQREKQIRKKRDAIASIRSG